MTMHRQQCDNTAAAMLLTGPRGELLLTERRDEPLGLAPPTTHVYDYATGTPGQYADLCVTAAVVHAEALTALTVDQSTMRMVIARPVADRCGRDLQPGREPGHHWRVFAATATGELFPCPERTRGANWFTRGQLYAVTSHTIRVLRGEGSATEYAYVPGLEPVWVWWLHLLGHLPDLSDADALLALDAAERGGIHAP